MDLHAIIVKKPYTLDDAKEIAENIAKDKLKGKTFIRETNSSYRVRVIPKTKFIKGSFKTKKINNQISLIYGVLI